MDAVATKSKKVTPFSLRDAPSLIERVWPAQKISVEAQKERKAGPGQTLTALGSYWKGRKPLILVDACVLGALLPATDDPVKDLEVFELLMGMAAEQTFDRLKVLPPPAAMEFGGTVDQINNLLDDNGWKPLSRKLLMPEAADALSRCPYQFRMNYLYRPEEVDTAILIDSRIAKANEHLGTTARTRHELIEQLGVMRFGHRPKVADVFCGGGSIPFAAARIGCDVYASDLNPIAAMLTWAAFRIIGATKKDQITFAKLQETVVSEVDAKLTHLGVEHDEYGNRAKTYLYCIEARCPQTGWMIPLSSTWLISGRRNTVARLKPDRARKRFDIEIASDVSAKEAELAAAGTIQGRDVVYQLDGQVYRTPIALFRGQNGLRLWEKSDFCPRPEDVFQERLYCIHWMTKETLNQGRQETYFAAPTAADIRREEKVRRIVGEHLAEWQSAGLIPDMSIEPGDKTDEPIRTRGWTYWHHLFSPRHLLTLSLLGRACRSDPRLMVALSGTLDFVSKLTRWVNSGRESGGTEFTTNVFSNQALNTFWNWGEGALRRNIDAFKVSTRRYPLEVAAKITVGDAKEIGSYSDIYITDPPYADAVNYHEITEFFIAWLRKNPPAPLNEWVWDSRRALAIKGDGEPFKRSMVAAYRAMADHMPDNGLQIVMFTHQDAAVWSDMAQILWGSGLRVMAAWYIATETTSELKKGGYVQGTVVLVLRRRGGDETGYKDEIVQEVKIEVAEQIETMVGLTQKLNPRRRSDNLFEDADLQMAGYAAALRVLTRYSTIDGIDMTKEAVRSQGKGERTLVSEIIEFAVQVANEHMVPQGMNPKTWENLTGAERFYFKMMDIETTGAKKLDNYQNFAKAFRVPAYDDLMGNTGPNNAALKTAKQFKKAGFEIKEFGPSKSRALLYAIYEVERDVDGDEALSHLRDQVDGYLNAREDLMALAEYVALKREKVDDEEARAARIVHGLIRNERFG